MLTARERDSLEVDLPSFMLEIENCSRSDLDQLAIDFFQVRSGHPPLDFCKRCSGLPETDVQIARRLGVGASTVHGWRQIGRRL